MKQVQYIDRGGGISHAKGESRLSQKVRERARSSSQYEGLMMHEGVYVLAPILMGLGVGYAMDTYLHTRPVFVMIFLLAGTASAFYNMFRLWKKA